MPVVMILGWWSMPSATVCMREVISSPIFGDSTAMVRKMPSPLFVRRHCGIPKLIDRGLGSGNTGLDSRGSKAAASFLGLAFWIGWKLKASLRPVLVVTKTEGRTGFKIRLVDGDSEISAVSDCGSGVAGTSGSELAGLPLGLVAEAYVR